MPTAATPSSSYDANIAMAPEPEEVAYEESNEFSNYQMNSVNGDEEEEEEEEEDDEDNEDEDEDDEEEDGDTHANCSTIVQAHPALASLSDPQKSLSVREIGNEAVWSLSTAKPGNGVSQIRDNSLDTYWQSDGGQPHLMNIHFLKRKSVCEIAFYLDYTQDESYTPKQLSIRAGITFHDLEEIKVVDLNEPVGWVSVPLHAEPDPLDDNYEDDDDEDENMNINNQENQDENNKRKKPLRTFLLQVCVVSMHQNGRDLHCRQIKVFGPRSETEALMRRTRNKDIGTSRFQTIEMSQFSSLR